MTRNWTLLLNLLMPIVAFAASGNGENPGGDVVQRREVQFRYQYAPDGKPHDVAIIKSSGYRELDRAALAAARFWILLPTEPHDMDASEHRRGRSS